MQHIQWQKYLSGLMVGLALLGCSQSPDTITQEETTGPYLPSPLVRLVRPPAAISQLTPDLVNKTVVVEGTVQQQVPLLEGGLYLVEDMTDQVWVFSLEALPPVGSTVQVEGVLQYEQIVVSGADISEYYLQERSRSRLESSTEPEAPTDVP